MEMPEYPASAENMGLLDKPGHLVRRLQQISTALFAEECGAFDLTSVQFAALAAISAAPGLDATRLSAIIAFDRSTLGDVLERLEGKGWVQRIASLQDRRVKCLFLTERGAQLLGQVAPAVARVQARLLAPLGGAEQAEMQRLLGWLVDLHEAAAEAGAKTITPKIKGNAA